MFLQFASISTFLYFVCLSNGLEDYWTLKLFSLVLKYLLSTYSLRPHTQHDQCTCTVSLTNHLLRTSPLHSIPSVSHFPYSTTAIYFEAVLRPFTALYQSFQTFNHYILGCVTPDRSITPTRRVFDSVVHETPPRHLTAT